MNDLLEHGYETLEVLSQGARSQTLRVRDQSQQERIVKSLNFQQLDQWKIFELFEREVKTLKRLDHPRIPKVMDYFQGKTENKSTLYLVTQKMPGKNLLEHLKTGWRPTEDELIQIAIELLDILIYLHNLYPMVIHRDIKPSNILMDELKRVFLIDFGAVKDALRVKRSSTIVGTFGYLAPEQYMGRAGPGSDLYGLGTTLIHLLSGKEPAQMNYDQMRLNFRPHVSGSDSFLNWLETLTATEASQRFESAEEAKAVLTGDKVSRPAPVAKRRDPERFQVLSTPERLKINVPALPLKYLDIKKGLAGTFVFGFFLFVLLLLMEAESVAWYALPLTGMGVGALIWGWAFYEISETLSITGDASGFKLRRSNLWGLFSRSVKTPHSDYDGLRYVISKERYRMYPLALRRAGKVPWLISRKLNGYELLWLEEQLLGFALNHLSPPEAQRLLKGHAHD